MISLIRTWQYTLLAIVMVVIGVVTVALKTHFLSADTRHTALDLQRSHILAMEVAAFSIIAIELFGKALVQRTRDAYMMQIGMSLRAVFRTVAYLILTISLVAILSTNSTLAISVGSFTGLVLAFASQNLIGNVIAGMFIAISRPFRMGDEVTVMGNTGIVREIGTMFTVLDSGDHWTRVPNMLLLTTLLQQKKDRKEP